MTRFNQDNLQQQSSPGQPPRVCPVPHTLVMLAKLKHYESETIKPKTSNCPNTDTLGTNMSNLHTMTSTRISTRNHHRYYLHLPDLIKLQKFKVARHVTTTVV